MPYSFLTNGLALPPHVIATSAGRYEKKKLMLACGNSSSSSSSSSEVVVVVVVVVVVMILKPSRGLIPHLMILLQLSHLILCLVELGFDSL